jgi:hypothetical protein
VQDGLRMLLSHKLLRPIIVISALVGFFEAGLLLYILAALLVPLAAGPIAVVVVILMLGKALGGITDTARTSISGRCDRL